MPPIFNTGSRRQAATHDPKVVVNAVSSSTTRYWVGSSLAVMVWNRESR